MFEIHWMKTRTFWYLIELFFYFQVVDKFRQFASMSNVHVTLVMHPRKEDSELLTINSIFGGAKAVQEADNVLILQEEILSKKLRRKFLQVVKNRFSGDLGILPLRFCKDSKSFTSSDIVVWHLVTVINFLTEEFYLVLLLSSFSRTPFVII